MRVVSSKLLAAVLLTLCVGCQALEATGRWDQTFKDAGDEAVIVTIVLCIGAAIVVAKTSGLRGHPSRVDSSILIVRHAPPAMFVRTAPIAFGSNSPPFLRI